MTPNSDWWARAHEPPKPAVVACDAGRVVTMTLGHNVASLDVRCVPSIGHELVLFINGELRRGRVFRRNQPLEIIQSITDTVRSLQSRGWQAAQEKRADFEARGWGAASS